MLALPAEWGPLYIIEAVRDLLADQDMVVVTGKNANNWRVQLQNPPLTPVPLVFQDSCRASCFSSLASTKWNLWQSGVQGL